jgi:hypothetical protein
MPVQLNAEAKVTLDFSKVTSVAKAKELEAKGELVKTLLFPAEFGGEDIPANVVYVPAIAAEAKDMITGTLVKFVKDDLIDNLSVEPEYKGNSIVPSRIVMKATHQTKEGQFVPTIEIW